MARLIVVVSGTDTEIGKTWVGARLATELRAGGVAVAARKPVQSFDPDEGPTDAELLAAATGEGVEDVTPRHRWYPRAVAPPMAADILGLPRIELAELASETLLPADGVCLVEGVGGPRSPLAHDGDTVALAHALDGDLVALVAPPGLGTINAVALSVDAFAPLPVVVFLNRFDGADDLHVRNKAWLENELGLAIATTIHELAGVIRRQVARGTESRLTAPENLEVR